MFDEATILARLQNGEDAQKIADEMAAALNKVNKIYTDQKAKEDAERKAKNDTEIQKKKDLQDILDSIHLWLDTYFEIDDLDDIFNEITADTVLEMIDAFKEYVQAMASFKAIFDVKPTPKAKAPIGTRAIPVKRSTSNPDVVLNDFLAKMGW